MHHEHEQAFSPFVIGEDIALDCEERGWLARGMACSKMTGPQPYHNSECLFLRNKAPG